MKGDNHNKFTILIAMLFILPSSGVIASEWNLGVSQFRFDSEFSAESGIEEDAWTLGAEIGFNAKKHLVIGAGAYVLFLDDNKQFSEEVVPVDGPNVSHTSKSSETGGALYAYGKVHYPFTERVSGNLLFGYEHINFDREIENCVDCSSDNVDVDAGFYAGAGAYQAYLGGSDVSDQITIRIGKAF